MKTYSSNKYCYFFKKFNNISSFTRFLINKPIFNMKLYNINSFDFSYSNKDSFKKSPNDFLDEILQINYEKNTNIKKIDNDNILKENKTIINSNDSQNSIQDSKNNFTEINKQNTNSDYFRHDSKIIKRFQMNFTKGETNMNINFKMVYIFILFSLI